MIQETAEIDGLMDQASSGDDDAFSALALRMQDRLFRLALASGLKEADAAEIVQETFLRAFRARAKWRRGRRAAPWLCGIALNVIRERRRGWWNRIRLGLGVSMQQVQAAAVSDEANETTPDRLRNLSAAIANLPPRQREIITCRFLLQMSVYETALAMGCAEGTIKAGSYRAIQNLRRRLMRKHGIERSIKDRPEIIAATGA